MALACLFVGQTAPRIHTMNILALFLCECEAQYQLKQNELSNVNFISSWKYTEKKSTIISVRTESWRLNIKWLEVWDQFLYIHV